MTTVSVNGGVYRRIAELARSLHGSATETTQLVLQRVVGCAVGEVPGAQYAGITVAMSRSHIETPAATHPYPALLDVVQQRHQQGPCLSAARRQHAVRIDDLTTDERWPHYRKDALEATPIRSILSLHLFSASNIMGAFNVYADLPHAFDGDAEAIGDVLATHAALALDTVRREDQFRSALASRDAIGQAKGILMARLNISAAEAFELLKRLSQENNTKLADIAARVTKLRNIDGL